MNWFTMNEILGQVKLVEGGFYLLVKCILLNGSKDQICPCHVTCDWSFLAKFGAQPDIQKCLWFIFFVVITQLEQILPKKTDSLCLKFFSIYGGGVYLFIPFYIRMWLQKPIFSIALKSFFAAFSAVDLMIDKYQQVVWPFIPFMQIAGIILQARRI